jgi:NAD(P)-dependent dehydrogenase (short-subunit alcohol dehydrogenase family)
MDDARQGPGLQHCAMTESRHSGGGFVVVTGTSTGIGAATVSRLARLGFRVFAGVRHAEDAESARSSAKAAIDGKPFAGVSVSRRCCEGNLGDIRKLGEQAGGTWTGSTHFVSDGNLVPLPRPNLKADDAEGAKRDADELADKVLGGSPAAAASSVGKRGDR